ncbi:Magnetosome protein MamR [Azospirillaceae bacterium]|nr:magnetosome protein MamR [uncultured bacterium]
MWTLVLRSGAVLSIALAGVQLFDMFFREIRPHRLYSSGDAARLLGVERRDIIRLARQGAIQSKKVDGNYWILGQNLLDYLSK